MANSLVQLKHQSHSALLEQAVAQNATLFVVIANVEAFKARLRDNGLQAATRWLNDRVPHRYTAVFAFHGETLRNLSFVDKQNPETTHCPDSPITESYCIYIQRFGERFCVEEASKDSRVQGHPKQRSYQCYYGVPLYGSDGRILGTVCHFDTSPIRVTEDVAALLDDVGPILATAAFVGR